MSRITVGDLCFLYLEGGEIVKIYDLNPDSQDYVYEETFDDTIFSKYANYEICSFEVTNDRMICLNIDTREEM